MSLKIIDLEIQVGESMSGTVFCTSPAGTYCCGPSGFEDRETNLESLLEQLRA